MDVSRLSYKPGWKFKMGGPLGRFLCINVAVPDSRDTRDTWRPQFMFEMPEFDTDREGVRWVFDRLLECERHEAGEFFTFDGYKPFYPNHQEGDPYALVERWPDPKEPRC
jgi:hypothetical protein